MAPIALVTDSTSVIPAELVAKYGIFVGPQVVIWDGKTLEDGVDIMPDAFYARLKTSPTMPTTSQVTVASFQKIFAPLVAAGRPIIAILVSTKLSGSIDSAEQAKKEFPGAQIEIVDSMQAGMALGFQVLMTARQVAAGRSLAEVAAYAHQAKDHTGTMLVVDTLEFLHRGGRIGGAQRLLGTALNMKPLLHVENGRIEPLERIRTKAKALARMMDLLEEKVKGHGQMRIAAMHAAAESDAAELLALAKGRFSPVESILSWASPAIGTHTGPGTVAVGYCVDL
ncbi:MAG TPA: DegV family protein [Anaerolineales bacterium]|nr:DegV family protein [Anaerolineales bacterium]